MESPAKRQKTNQGGSNATQNSYNSEEDSGDELFAGYETIATVPIERPPVTQTQSTQLLPSSAQHVTQPTQLLERPQARPKSRDESPSVVQVVASSPLRGLTPSKPITNRPKLGSGGVLASAMAPPGTAFRQPFGVQKAPVRKPVIIDLSDDDEGPIYQGDSSDDATTTRKTVDIKPSTFAKSGKSTGPADVTTERVEESPNKAMSKFKDITSNSFYKPLDKTKAKGSSLSGSLFDSRNRNEDATSSTTSGLKRAAGTVINGKPQSTQARQSGPQRARQIEDLSLDSIDDVRLRDKIARMRRVLPSMTVLTCRNALLQKKGNYDDAMDLLVSQEDHVRDDQIDLTMSDEEAHPSQSQAAKQTAKRQVKAPARTIQDKYSLAQTLPVPPSPPVPKATPPKPRKRLVQGKKATPIQETAARSPTPESFDDSDSGVEIASEEDHGLEGRVLKFFNECSVKDLADISNITEEVAGVILAQKPFTGLGQVRQISSDTPSAEKGGKRKSVKKPIGDKVVDTCLDMWTGYEAVDELVTKCEALGKPVAEVMSTWGFDVSGAAKDGELEMVSFDDAKGPIRDSGVGTPTSSPPAANDDDEGEGDIRPKGAVRSKEKKNGLFLGQPSNMSSDTVLKDYQLVGLNWLALLFDKQLSCILADEMGLGKTCQVIAFLAHLLEKGVQGPHLVVVPGSTLENWLRECQRFCPALAVEPYYGAEKDRAEMRLQIEGNIKHINVIITTYDLAAKKVDSKFLRHLKPTVCVYDEGHALKNSKSLRYTSLMRIPAKFRLLLTGTPLQNNLKELAALLGFILPSVFSDRKDDLEYIFKHKARTKDSDHAALLSAQRIARAKSMMTPFVLRRKKHQVLKHLPPKTTRVEYCELTPSQSAVYANELSLAREAMQARLDGEKPKNESGNVMMQLRKAAIHPLLFRRLFTDATIRKMARDCLREPELASKDFDYVLEDMEYYSDFKLHQFCDEYPGTMARYDLEDGAWMDSGKVAALAALLEGYQSAGDRVLVFSQFTLVLDILEAVLETLGMQYFRLDGQTRIDERQDMIDQFYEEKDVTVFLMSTKAGGMGINLACANKVVIFDQSFNPQEDVQAENRAHRVGQEREVEVVRLVTRGTIEEQILALGETKLALDERVSGVKDVGGVVVEGSGGEEKGEGMEKRGMEMVREMWLQETTAGEKEDRQRV